MYDSQYYFTGRHAGMVNALVKGEGEKKGVFARVLDVLLLAPVVGFHYGTQADKDASDESISIFLEQLNRERSKLELAYQTITLLDEKHEPDQDRRISKAFRVSFDMVDREDVEWYDSYVRGGVEVLYNKIFMDSDEDMDCMQSISAFLDDIQYRYYPEDAPAIS